MGKKKYKEFKQGCFTPLNKDKYTGTTPIVYRSSWELKFMRWCDRNSKVLKWGSESVIIPYLNPLDSKVHRYFVDYNIVYEDNNTITKYLVEIKPSLYVNPPKVSKRRKPQKILQEQLIYAKNRAKWDAAEQWCKKHKFKFLILTEKELQIK